MSFMLLPQSTFEASNRPANQTCFGVQHSLLNIASHR